MKIDGNLSSAAARKLATTAIIKTKRVKFFSDVREINDGFLTSIEERGTPTEREIASCVNKASKEYLFDKSAVWLQVYALKALKGGIQSPVSVVLADIGAKALLKAENKKDARILGIDLLKGIIKNSDDKKERIVANAGLAASKDYIGDKKTHQRQLKSFQTIADGDTSPVGNLLSNFGCKIIKEADVKDKFSVGKQFLEGIRDVSEKPEERMLAKYVLNAIDSKKGSTANIGEVYYEKALGVMNESFDIPSDKMFAQLGRLAYTELVNGKNPQERKLNCIDIKKIGSELLKGIIKNSNNDTNKNFAEFALTASSESKDPEEATRIQFKAFKSIQKAK